MEKERNEKSIFLLLVHFPHAPNSTAPGQAALPGEWRGLGTWSHDFSFAEHAAVGSSKWHPRQYSDPGTETWALTAVPNSHPEKIFFNNSTAFVLPKKFTRIT